MSVPICDKCLCTGPNDACPSSFHMSKPATPAPCKGCGSDGVTHCWCDPAPVPSPCAQAREQAKKDLERAYPAPAEAVARERPSAKYLHTAKSLALQQEHVPFAKDVIRLVDEVMRTGADVVVIGDDLDQANAELAKLRKDYAGLRDEGLRRNAELVKLRKEQDGRYADHARVLDAFEVDNKALYERCLSYLPVVEAAREHVKHCYYDLADLCGCTLCNLTRAVREARP